MKLKKPLRLIVIISVLCLLALSIIILSWYRKKYINEQHEKKRSEELQLKFARETATGINSCSAWIYCARKYIQISKDNTNAEKCLLKAENLAKNFNDWMECSVTWKSLGKNGNAKKCLLKAESKAYNSYDMKACATLWLELGDLASCNRCSKKAKKFDEK